MSISFKDSLEKTQLEVETEQPSVTPLSFKSVANEGITVASVIEKDNGTAVLAEKENAIVAYDGDGWTLDDKYEYYPEYYDDVVSVINDNKTISLISKQINLTQETNSQFIPFEMPRYYDGFDLQTTNIVFYYVNKNKSDGYVKPINVYYSDEKIRFAWLVDKYVTAIAGEVQFEVQAIGVNSKGNEYVWKTKAASLNILESLSGNGTLPDGGDVPSVYQVYERIEKLETKVDDLHHVPIKIESIINNVRVVEKGSKVKEMTVTWKLNKEPTCQNLDGEDVAITERQKVVDMEGKTSVILIVTDEKGKIATAKTGYSAYNGIYYGAIDANTIINSSVINAMPVSYQSSIDGTFKFTATDGQKLTFVAPVSYGEPSKFVSDGLSYTWTKLEPFEHENLSGHKEQYNIWQNDEITVGTFNIIVEK